MSRIDVDAVCALFEEFARTVPGDISDHVLFIVDPQPDGSMNLIGKPKTPEGSDLIRRMKALDQTEH